MLGIALLASHLAGDFLLQNRWHSARKFTVARERYLHVTWYVLAFVPVACVYAQPWWGAPIFLALLWVVHELTDRRRYASTVGDVVGWRARVEFDTEAQRQAEWMRQTGGRIPHGTVYDRCPPNPWPSMPLMIDQSWHAVQLAVLAAVFLT